jgi:hypothetical protein
VADVKHRDFQFVVEFFQVGQDFLLAGQVQGRQGLVHEQDARAHRQSARDAHPLALAAGQPVRLAFQQMADAQQLDGLAQADPALRRTHPLHAEFQVAADTEVGEQAGFLEYVTQGPAMGGQESGPVLPDLTVDGDLAPLRPLQAGDEAQKSGFARAGRAEQGGDTAPGQVQVHVQGEAGTVEVEADVDGVHTRTPPRSNSPLCNFIRATFPSNDESPLSPLLQRGER